VAIVHRQALLAYDEGRYHDALRGLLEVHATDPDNLSVQHLIGRCLLYGLAQPELAIPYLQQASARVSTTYDRWALDQRDAPTTTLFDLGKAYELSGQYPEAKGAYTLFLGHLRPSKGVEGRRMYTNVVRGIEACDLQMEAHQGISMSAPATEE
jgi:tetratricopeptide (TPR) repeat protein